MIFKMNFPLMCLSILLTPLCGATAPSKAYISSVFSHISGPVANYKAFFDNVSPSVNWTIEGTHPLAGQYHNRTVLETTFARISAVAAPSTPLIASVVRITRDSDDDWSVQELHILGTCRNGLKFDNRYAWVTRWANGTIVEARAYLDSALVSAALQQNEIATLFTYSDLRPNIIPWVTLNATDLKGATGLEKKS